MTSVMTMYRRDEPRAWQRARVRLLSAILIVSCLAVTACDESPPATPSPSAGSASTPTASPHGTRDAAIAVTPGPGIDVPIAATPPRATTFVLAERADVVLSWSGARPDVTGADGFGKACGASSCQLPMAPPGPYLVEPKAAPLHIAARALALPPAATLKLGAAIELHPAAIAADDPRGPLADATLHVDTAGLVTLIVRPLSATGARKDLNALIKLVALDVFGPQHEPMATTELAETVPGALQTSFDVAPGDYRLRATGVAVEVRAQPLGAIRNRIDETPITAAAAAPLLHAGATLDITAQPSPGLRLTWVKLPPGYDLAIEWPEKVMLGLEWAHHEHLCERSPCLVDHIDGGLLGIDQEHKDAGAALTAHVRVLPLPAVQPGLGVGHDLQVSTAPVVDRDPRVAVAEVAVDLPAAGYYEIIAKDLDWKRPADVMKAPPLADLAILHQFPPMTGMFVGEDDIRDGISRVTITTDGAEHHVLRIDGNGRAAPRRLTLSCVTRSPPGYSNLIVR